MIYAPSDSSQAADNMFYFTLGRLLPIMCVVDTCFIISSDKDWLHALDILRSVGFEHVHIIKDVSKLRANGIQLMSPECVASRAVNKTRPDRN